MKMEASAAARHLSDALVPRASRPLSLVSFLHTNSPPLPLPLHHHHHHHRHRHHHRSSLPTTCRKCCDSRLRRRSSSKVKCSSQAYGAMGEVGPRSPFVRLYDGNKEECDDYVDEAILDDDIHKDMVDEREEKMEDEPVLMHDTRTFPPVLSLPQARSVLLAAVEGFQSNAPVLSSGIVRFQVPFPIEIKALKWLQSQKESEGLFPRFYFSARGRCAKGCHEEDMDVLKGIAGIGSAMIVNGKHPFSAKDIKYVKRFLSKDFPLIRAYGAMRFNADMEPSEEWKSFGSFFFSIPQIEFCECPTCNLLVVTVAWDETVGRGFQDATRAAKATLLLLSDQVSTASEAPINKRLHSEHVPSEQEWHCLMEDLSEILEYNQEIRASASEGTGVGLSKVVLARQTKVEVDDCIQPLSILSILQEKDPTAYQFYIQLANRQAFLGSTPERLFYKDGDNVFTEAVAGTRARGETESKDYGSSLELLLRSKDHIEFDIVMENVKDRLEVVCKNVKVNSYKTVIKQANVQHLYGSLVGQLEDGNDEFHLLTALHPTPAICGQPRNLAKRFLKENEAFDRGMYAGPVGWISGKKSEFAVAIRSSLVSRNEKDNGTCLCLYAGVGIVKGAESLSEWRELDLKIKQFEALLQPISALTHAVNINALWANLIVEECCRLGVTYFCIAPGSRSSPLAVAAAENRKASCISCIDERSLAFHALGYGRGASKPAVVITSSGTAVSNLLPAVVEAHEDCIPLILLTADRPPELQQTGANQAIDQVTHFGTFVRHQINLPPPCADIKSRMVLTSIDAAIFMAISDPMGPVHINISFREPLAGTPEAWNSDCLDGLGRWASNTLPFTRYIKMMESNATKPGYISCGEIKVIADILSSTSCGMLVVGGLQKVEESWAVILLAKHLGWPVIPDILSGIRLHHSNARDEDKLYIIDYFDHMLLSTELQNIIKPEVVLQIGARLTSKQLSRFLEDSQPANYILVEEHPFRHDPSHILTHRVQSPIRLFVTDIMSCCIPQPGGFSKQLQLLSDVIGKEISFQFDAELTLSEPHVARIVANSLPLDSAFFLGNSMPIRDSDMYCEGGLSNTKKLPAELNDLPWSFVRVAGNRGASGIDGILSTAVGFAAGCGQRVTLLLGDLSFLHDTNGLMLLNKREGKPPIVVIVINNSGGGIFSFLPIVNTASSTTFTNFLTTPQDVSIQNLCRAHRVNHTLVQSREQLVETLNFVQRQQLSWVVEVKSCVKENFEIHRNLKNSTKKAIERALQVIQTREEFLDMIPNKFCIQSTVYHRYRIQLSTHPTTMQGASKKSEYREGFLFCIHLSNGVCGYGEVAPLEGLHKETLRDVSEQLQLLGKLLQNMKFDNTLAFLNGNFSKWLSTTVGLSPETLFPSVRCGLEMALLGALANANYCSIVELLNGSTSQTHYVSGQRTNDGGIRICALLDSCGTPAEMALAALNLVQQGFCTLKVKVARRVSPLEDAAVILAIREAVGPRIHIRADANQRWTYNQAVEFSRAVHSCGLQYLEEPVKDLDDLTRFSEESDIPTALDESIDRNPDEAIKLFMHLGISAAIIKPSAVGGFERAAYVARCAQRHGMLAVISSSFESSIGLSVYAQFASFVDERYRETVTSNEVDRKAAHGLGTYMWLKSDVVCQNRFSVKATGHGMEVSIHDAAKMTSSSMVLNKETVEDDPLLINEHSQVYTVESFGIEYAFHVITTTCSSIGGRHDTVLVFLHGFLGSSEDWLPIMHALALSSECVSIDLPGHGKTRINDEGIGKPFYYETTQALDPLSMENVAQALSSLLRCMSKKKVILVGYSMGARIALHMAVKFNSQVLGAVIISGTPGIEEPMGRQKRVKEDHAISESMLQLGVESFIPMWYRKQMWSSLRSHPCFAKLIQSRLQHQDSKSLARIASSLSVGKQPSLWDDLADPPVPLLIVAGKKDRKFMEIAQKMYNQTTHRPKTKLGNGKRIGKFADNVLEQEEMLFCGDRIDEGHNDEHRVEKEKRKYLLLVEETGHAVHLENPVALASGISNFVSKLQ